MEEENSGICSPPLWQNITSPDSPVRHGVLSPGSRAQAIARGKREIMEMVQNMPETSYELSLKDLVEQRKEYVVDTSNVDETQSMEENEERSILHKKKASVKRQESNKTGKIVVRNKSTNHNKGLFINMFFPFSVGSKKKKTSITTSLSFGKDSIKYSPKPELLDKSGGDRRDWWWKKYTGSGDSESLGITSSSSGDSTRRSGSSGSSGSSAAGSLHRKIMIVVTDVGPSSLPGKGNREVDIKICVKGRCTTFPG
ncbi:hypothetical protein Tco_0121775 [Tanacetum coccineum]